jgi:hypothetical protein
MANKCVRVFRLALISLGISALSICLILLAGEQKTVQYTLAAVFWLSLIAELSFLAIGNRLRKKIEQLNPHMKQRRRALSVGLLCFLQNREAAIADLLLLISIGYAVTISLLRVSSMWLNLIGIVSTYVFFHLHCILNGILYKSIQHYKKVIQKRRGRK